MSQLADIAPRLSRARDAYITTMRAEDRRRLHLAHLICRAERLVAHRDLQIARASATRAAARDQRYMAVRYRKLADAERWLARLRHELDHLDDWRRPRP